MYACMTPVGFDTSDKFENHCYKALATHIRVATHGLRNAALHSLSPAKLKVSSMGTTK